MGIPITLAFAPHCPALPPPLFPTIPSNRPVRASEDPVYLVTCHGLCCKHAASPPARSASCNHPCKHTYVHNGHTDPDTGCKPNCLPRGPNSSSSLRSRQSPCPIFKQSCLDSPRIKTSGKLQAQTSTSFSLKQNMSLCMCTHPETHFTETSQSPCYSEHSPPPSSIGCGLAEAGGWQRQDLSICPWHLHPSASEELGPNLRHHSVAAGQNRGSSQGCQYSCY